MTLKRSNRLGLRHFTLLAGSILWPLTACSAVSNEQADIEVQPKPNIVLIVTDDQGYGDLDTITTLSFKRRTLMI